MKLGLIGDIHAEDELLASALAALKSNHSVNKILCVGDIADGPGDIDRCVQLLQDFEVDTVRGNHDEWLLLGVARNVAGATQLGSIADSTQRYIAALPQGLDVKTPDGLLLLCHGMAGNNMARVKEDDFDFPYTVANHPELQVVLKSNRYGFVVFGHTHRPWLRNYAGVCFVNAGTLKSEHDPGFAVLDTATRTLEWVPLA